MGSTLPNPQDCCDCSEGSSVIQTTLDSYISDQVGDALGFFAVDTIADLRVLSSSSDNKKATVWGNAAVDDGYTTVWRWDGAGTEADDGTNYVRPNDFTSAGLWVRAEI